MLFILNTVGNVVQGNYCVCAAGYVNTGTTCVQCPAGMFSIEWFDYVN